MTKKKLTKNDNIVMADEGLVNDFCYTFIKDVFKIECLFISDLSLITDFFCEDERGEEGVANIFDKIIKHYGITFEDYTGELEIYKIADFIFNKLGEKELE